MRAPKSGGVTEIVVPPARCLHSDDGQIMTTEIRAPYSREEMEIVGDGLPVRGPVCEKCGAHIPSFADVPPEAEKRIRQLIREGRASMAQRELVTAIGCPERWAELWVSHSGRAHHAGEKLCWHCGREVEPELGDRCPRCHVEWFDPAHPAA